MKLSDLHPNDENPRKITEKKLKQLQKSLKEFGDLGGIVFNRRTGHLVGGHQRIKVFETAGSTSVDARDGMGWVTLDNGVRFSYREVDWPETKEKAANIAANKGAGEWDRLSLEGWFQDLKAADFDLDLTMFDESERKPFFVNTIFEDGITNPDYVPEAAETRCKPGDLWLMGDHRLICGDCTDALEVQRLLNGESPILMVTDPPYGVEYDPEWRKNAGVSSHTAVNMGKVKNDERFDWSETWAIFDAQVMYVWHAGRFSSEVARSMQECDYEIISQIIWAKPSLVISRGDYHWQHEPCWYAHKKKKTHNWQGARDQSTLWKIERGGSEETGHGTQKPIDCMERPIRNNTEVGQLVVDPFLGSGTTLIAAEKTKRKCYGMEIDPKYCDIILKRWEEFTGKQAVLSDSEKGD